MFRTFAIAAVFLVVAGFFMAHAAFASTANDIITINKTITLGNHETVYLDKITITGTSQFNSYSPDPDHSVWPVLDFTYRDDWTGPISPQLHAQFVDDKGNVYSKVDYANQPLSPGKSSETGYMEVSIPKNNTLSKIIIKDIWADNPNTIVTIPLSYIAHNEEPSQSIAEVPDVVHDDNMRNLMIIPIILVIVGLVGWIMAKKRIF